MALPVPILPSDSTLMRRLVESIESRVTGSVVFVVAEPEFPHTVYGLDSEVSAALESHLENHPAARLYGPFRSSRPEPMPVTLTAPPVQNPGDVWVHYDPSTWQKIHGASGALVTSSKGKQGVERRELVAQLLGVSPEEAGHIDTICIGPAAYRKFVVPYLVQVYGIEEAMRRSAE